MPFLPPFRKNKSCQGWVFCANGHVVAWMVQNNLIDLAVPRRAVCNVRCFNYDFQSANWDSRVCIGNIGGGGVEGVLAQGQLWGNRAEAAEGPFWVGMDSPANRCNLLCKCATQRLAVRPRQPLCRC